MIALANDIAVHIATKAIVHAPPSSAILPEGMRLPPLGSPGLKSFPVLIIASLALLCWVTFGYSPGSAGNNERSDTHKDN